MKKIIGICICCMMLLCGCGTSKGSFVEGTMNMDMLFDDLSEQINEGDWNMRPLNDIWWDKSQVEKAYHLDMTMISECYVKSSAAEAEFSEIAFFKVPKKYDADMKDAIHSRIEALEKKWGTYMMDAEAMLKSVRQGRIGKYYYMILGDDSKKVVNYIRNLT